MKKYTLEKLAEILRADKSGRDDAVTAISTDSRSIKKGDCFFAIPGPNFDGHDFIPQALDAGAKYIVHHSDLAPVPGVTFIKVDDTVKALGRLAADYRARSSFKVIAITGSVGKTTTRHITAHVLASRSRVYQAPKSFNNHIGLPLTLLAARPDDQFVIAELGANNPGEIAYLSCIARPDLAVVTNIYPAHLEGFAGIDTIIEEKLSIALGLSANGSFLINGDQQNLLAAARRRHLQFTTFGFSQHCDIRPQHSDWDHTQSCFTVDSVTINIPLPGRGNLENALAAWAICSKLDFTPPEFADAVKNLPPVPMRAEIRRLGNVTVIDDSYNANPASMKNALELLAEMAARQQQRPVFICGDMAELGARSRTFHEQLALSIVEAKVQLLIAVGPLADVAASTAKQLADYDLHVEFFPDADSAADNLHKFIKDYDILLVKGSRTVALEKTVKKLRELFERQVTTVEK